MYLPIPMEVYVVRNRQYGCFSQFYKCSATDITPIKKKRKSNSNQINVAFLY